MSDQKDRSGFVSALLVAYGMSDLFAALLGLAILFGILSLFKGFFHSAVNFILGMAIILILLFVGILLMILLVRLFKLREVLPRILKIFPVLLILLFLAPHQNPFIVFNIFSDSFKLSILEGFCYPELQQTSLKKRMIVRKIYKKLNLPRIESEKVEFPK